MKTTKNINKQSKKTFRKPYLTVIIPTLNEMAFLPHLLDALERQTRLADEVIVADAGSKDGTEDIARAHGVRVVRGGLPAIGRNAGARAAHGQILLFLDADVLPEPDFIAHSLVEFENKKFDVATCYIAALDKNPMDRLISIGTNLYFRVVQPISPHAPGFCILSKRKIHKKMGGFDESLFISEDIDYARRATQYGKFGFLSNARIPVSMRRVEKEGLVGIGLKYAWCEIYALVGKPVRAAPFKYEFGMFSPPRKNGLPFLISKLDINRRWKKVAYPLQDLGGKIIDQFSL